MRLQIGIRLQNLGIACSVASFFTLFFRYTAFEWMTEPVFHIPVFFVVLFLAGLVIAEDLRNAFKKIFWYEKREEKRPIWQVGIGLIFFLAQIGLVMVFLAELTQPKLGGMPLFIVVAFMNSFILTALYEELLDRQDETEEMNH